MESYQDKHQQPQQQQQQPRRRRQRCYLFIACIKKQTRTKNGHIMTHYKR